VKRRLHIGGKAALTRLDALERTPSVIIGWLPSKEDAKAEFTPEETRNRELCFAESSPTGGEDVNNDKPARKGVEQAVVAQGYTDAISVYGVADIIGEDPGDSLRLIEVVSSKQATDRTCDHEFHIVDE
jgi:hypothetical protein